MGVRLQSEIKARQKQDGLKLLQGTFLTRTHLCFCTLPTRFATADATASTIPFFHSLGFGMTTATSSKSMQMCECVCNRQRGGRKMESFVRDV